MIDEKSLDFISYGLYIVSSKNNVGSFDAMIANTLFQVTAEPARLAVVMNKHSLTHDYVKESKVFVAMPLIQNVTLPFIGTFGFRSGRDINKFEKVAYKLSPLGAPIVTEKTAAAYEVLVEQEVDLNTHTMFIGAITSAEIIDSEECLTYEYYRHVIKGKTPVGATHK